MKFCFRKFCFGAIALEKPRTLWLWFIHLLLDFFFFFFFLWIGGRGGGGGGGGGG
jgi:hypothetical protein